MALITTPGASDANAYCDVAQADAYVGARVGTTAWAAADTATKEAAIQHGTRMLDMLQWHGAKSVPAGSLRWPRINVYDMDGYAVPSAVIPDFLADACAEYAFTFVRDGDVTAPPDTAGLEGLKVSSLSFAFDTGSGSDSQGASPYPKTVLDMVSHYMENQYGQPMTVRA